MLSDTYYGNAGLDGGFLHPRFNKHPALYAARLAVAWIGTMLMWAGLYNVIDLHVFPADFRASYRTQIDMSLLGGGLLLLFLSKSFYWYAIR